MIKIGFSNLAYVDYGWSGGSYLEKNDDIRLILFQAIHIDVVFLSRPTYIQYVVNVTHSAEEKTEKERYPKIVTFGRTHVCSLTNQRQP